MDDPEKSDVVGLIEFGPALRGDEAPRAVAAEPLIAASGARGSWLTIPRNSARSLASSSSGVMSCTVATIDAISPSSARIGVAFTRVVTS